MHLAQHNDKESIFLFVCAKLTTMGHHFHTLKACMFATNAFVFETQCCPDRSNSDIQSGSIQLTNNAPIVRWPHKRI